MRKTARRGKQITPDGQLELRVFAMWVANELGVRFLSFKKKGPSPRLTASRRCGMVAAMHLFDWNQEGVAKAFYRTATSVAKARTYVASSKALTFVTKELERKYKLRK